MRADATRARELGLPIITPPADWETRKTCTNETVTFTPDPTEPSHPRKLMRRFWGFCDLTHEETKAIDAEYLRRHRGGNVTPLRKVA